MKLPLLAVTLFTAVAAFAADKIPLTFSAVLSTGKEMRFGIATEGGTHSAWLALGGEFQGYKLSEYDEDSQTLILQRNGVTHRLPIASGNVKPLSSKATLEDATAVLGKMKFEEMMKKQIVSAVSKQALDQIGRQVPDAEFAAFQAKVMDTLAPEMKPEEMRGEVAKIYADLFTKEELRGLSDFYATPAGSAWVDKQPQVQEKMRDLMMPRMAKTFPRILEISKEFTKEQQAKASPSSPAGMTKSTTPTAKPPATVAPAAARTAAPVPAPAKKS